MDESWDSVRFLEVGPPLEDPVLSGHPIPLRATVELGSLKASDVRVEVVIGRVNGGCVDSSSTNPIGASLHLKTTSYGPTVRNPLGGDKYAIESNS